jgi:metal-sulfur cluster biosynthetic enzyme
MAEPTMSTDSPDGVPPRPQPPLDPARPLHDRELPVNAPEADRVVHPTADASGDAVSTRTSGSAASDSLASEMDVDEDSAAEPLTTDQVKLALRRVKDPELNLNILDLGLVYDIRVEGNAVSIDMTLTSPGCPSGPEIMTDAERHLRAIPGVGDVSVNLVWSPFWGPERIEPRVRAYLGF